MRPEGADMQEKRVLRASRRELFGIVVAGTAAAMLESDRARAQATPAAAEGTRIAAAPDWSFIVHNVDDPYGGEIQVPQEHPPGTRFVAAEVEVINASDQPLAFTPIDIRLRTQDGIEYRGGSAIGTDPTINPRNLNPGERSRGWVIFTVPEASVAVEIVYFAPQPQFRVPI
jgi:hypothetical protein